MNFSTKKTTHVVCVRNKIVGICESKGFSISCTEYSMDQLFDHIKTFVDAELPKKLHQEFVIMRPPTRRKTHSIVVLSKLDQWTSKSISVDYPQHSSIEIARELQKYLCGGEATF